MYKKENLINKKKKKSSRKKYFFPEYKYYYAFVSENSVNYHHRFVRDYVTCRREACIAKHDS